MRISALRYVRFTSEFTTLCRKMVFLVFISTIVVCLQGVVLWMFDHGSNSKMQNPIDGIYFMVVSIFGETTAPATIGARLVTLFALFEGLIVGAYVVVVAAVFNFRGGSIFMKSHSGHIVICGWNFQGGKIIEELLQGSAYDIVVIPGDQRPQDSEVSDRRVKLIPGLATEDSVLRAANIESARSAIILTDPSLRPTDADAKTLMIGLAVETLNPDVYSSAQVMDSSNQIHLERAKVDEVIPLDILGANLAVAAAVSPGVTQVVNELLTFDEGSEFYRIDPLPKQFLQVGFEDTAIICRNKNAILVGVETHSKNRLPAGLPESMRASAEGDLDRYGRCVLVNPKNYVIGDSDALFVISDVKPDFAD